MASMPMLFQHSVTAFGGIGVGDHLAWAGVPAGAMADMATPGTVDTMVDITAGAAIGPVTVTAVGAGDTTITTITGMEVGIQAVAAIGVAIGPELTMQPAVRALIV